MKDKIIEWYTTEPLFYKVITIAGLAWMIWLGYIMISSPLVWTSHPGIR